MRYLALLALIPSAALAGTVTLNWTAPTEYVDNSAIPSTATVTFNVYGAECSSCASCTPVLIQSADRFTSAVISNVSPGTYCYVVTAVVGGVESLQSSPLTQVVVKSPQPKAPVVTSASSTPTV